MASRLERAVHKYQPSASVFHNGGHMPKGNARINAAQSHYELESLPTGGWGYDHFPLSALWAAAGDKEYLGMTGKFHTSWGEFGGYKHPNALLYEVLLSAALGAKCSVFVDPFPNKAFEATVTEINQQAEYNPRMSLTQSERANMVFWIKVSIKDTEGVIKPGMPADVTIL